MRVHNLVLTIITHFVFNPYQAPCLKRVLGLCTERSDEVCPFEEGVVTPGEEDQQYTEEQEKNLEGRRQRAEDTAAAQAPANLRSTPVNL